MTGGSRPLCWAALACGLALLAGCKAPPLVSVQDFCAAPAGWTDLEGGPVDLHVSQCHLRLDSDQAVVDPVAFPNVSAMVDVAFVGGEARGLAGILVVDPLGTQDGAAVYCLAVRPSGEWRLYRGLDPMDPVGGRGWQPARRPSPTGFWRLAVTASEGTIEFSVDGKSVGRYRLSAPGMAEDGDPLARTYRVGLFNRQSSTRWKSFAAGESTAEQVFRPLDHESWGTGGDGDACVVRAAKEAKDFRAQPDRMGIYAVTASLDEARRAQPTGQFASQAAKIARYMKPAAVQIGEEELLDRAFAAVQANGASGGGTGEAAEFLKRAREAESRGELGIALCLYCAAAESGAEPSVEADISRVKGDIPDLRLDFEATSRVPEPVCPEQDFWQAVREIYGGLQTAKGGELRIRVDILRSSNEKERTKGERRVAVYSKGEGKLQEYIEERDRIEKQLPDDLLEAQARATVIRTGAKILGPSSLQNLQIFDIDGKKHELPVDDGRRLQAARGRLAELGKLIAAEERKQSVKYRSIPAALHTSSILVEFATTVGLDGAVLVKAPKERVYLGIEQWEHPADPKNGVPASRFRPELVSEALETVHDRALRKFRSAISLESILSKLKPAEQVLLVYRLARSSGQEDARLQLEWVVQEELGIKGQLRGKVAARCLR